VSAIKAISYLLSHNSNLIAAVPAAKIFAGQIPINTVLPAVAVNEISTTEYLTVALNESKVTETTRVQVSVQTKTYATQKSILELVRKALPNTHATVNGVDVDSIVPEGAGPDLRDDDANIFMQSRDFMVRFSV